MAAYYNEFDEYAAQWLRNLIAAGHIADGDVDQRSINDVSADDLANYNQCHFFAGIGVWSHALRLAGWDDDRPVWTGSCPCQPFSAAGKGDGFDDERHLWPSWFHLIGERKPPVIFGEQVEAAIKHGWLDLVQTDLEGIGYAFAAAGIPAAGVGAPHIRQRLFFVADSLHAGRSEWGTGAGDRPIAGSGGACGVADTDQEQRGWRPDSQGLQSDGQACGREQGDRFAQPNSAAYRMDNADDTGLERFRGGYQTPGRGAGPLRPTTAASELSGLADSNDQIPPRGEFEQLHSAIREGEAIGLNACGETPGEFREPGPVNGRWSDADWLFCRDGKWRPVEPGTFPLVNGASARVGRLRAYGNAIVPQVAQAFIEAFLEVRP